MIKPEEQRGPDEGRGKHFYLLQERLVKDPKEARLMIEAKEAKRRFLRKQSAAGKDEGRKDGEQEGVEEGK